MNHRTKGDCMPRDSINDHPITCGESSSYFMFQLLSLTAGRASNGDFFLQSITNLWQTHSYLLRDHYLLPKCSGTKAWSSKGHSYLGFKMLPIEKNSTTPLSTCLSWMQNSTGFMKQIPLIMYFKFSITVEVNMEMQDLLIAQGSWVNSTLLTPQWGFPAGASGKVPPCQCRRHKRYGFNPWVGKSPWRRHGNPLQHSCLENTEYWIPWTEETSGL